MRKKIAIEIDEDVHKQMKAIALKQNRYVYDLYEEIAREFLNKSINQKTLDGLIEK